MGCSSGLGNYFDEEAAGRAERSLTAVIDDEPNRWMLT